MATMINDPEAVSELRNKLLVTVDGLQDQLRKTERAMDVVAEEWKDIQFQKYYDGFIEDKEKINPLCKDIEAFEDEVLRPLQEILEDYLDL